MELQCFYAIQFNLGLTTLNKQEMYIVGTMPDQN